MWILDYQNFGSSTLMSSDDHAKRQPCNLQRNGWVLLGVTSVVFLEFWQSLLISSISNLEFRQLVGGALVAIIMGECFHSMLWFQSVYECLWISHAVRILSLRLALLVIWPWCAWLSGLHKYMIVCFSFSSYHAIVYDYQGINCLHDCSQSV